MPPKPHRILIERVSGYASEAVAYVRRRRQNRRPYARVYRADGGAVDHGPETLVGGRMQHAADELIGRVQRDSAS